MRETVLLYDGLGMPKHPLGALTVGGITRYVVGVVMECWDCSEIVPVYSLRRQ